MEGNSIFFTVRVLGQGIAQKMRTRMRTFRGCFCCFAVYTTRHFRINVPVAWLLYCHDDFLRFILEWHWPNSDNIGHDDFLPYLGLSHVHHVTPQVRQELPTTVITSPDQRSILTARAATGRTNWTGGEQELVVIVVTPPKGWRENLYCKSGTYTGEKTYLFILKSMMDNEVQPV